jgi:hypothetical protein
MAIIETIKCGETKEVGCSAGDYPTVCWDA